MKNLYLSVALLATFALTAQEKQLSSASQFIDRSSYVQINMDATEVATFKSGLGETVTFYPAEIIDLKATETMFGLMVESTYITGGSGFSTTSAKETSWVGVEEIGDLIVWLEKYVIPNLETSAGRKKTVKYIFNCKELTLKFEIFNNTQIFSVIINDSLWPDKYFWTETKVKDIPKVLEVLKYLQTKK